MAITLVQQSTETTVTTNTTGAVTINGVTAGNMLVLMIINSTNGTSGFPTGVSDGTNTWVQDNGQQSSTVTGAVTIYSAQNVAAGNTTVTVTMSSATYRFRMYELSGLPAVTNLCGRETQLDAANATSHTCAKFSGIDSVTDMIVFCCGVMSANAGGFTAGSGFTTDSSGGGLYQRGIFTGAQVDATGPYTTGNSVKGNVVMAAYQATPAAGAGGGNIMRSSIIQSSGVLA